MCLIAVAWQIESRYPLLLAANRDEFHARPTAPLASWDHAPGLIGGRDQRAGGSWLAARRGRLAAVTNFREPRPPVAPRSRGLLTADFVRGRSRATRFAERVGQKPGRYGPFNLLLYDGTELVWSTNRPHPAWQSVSPGIHGVANGSPSFVTPPQPWPKVRRLNAALQQWLQQPGAGNRPDPEPIFRALGDRSPAADDELPDTGVGLDIERQLSPPFVRGEHYGTRCSTVGWVERDGTVVLIERRFDAAGTLVGETRQQT